MLLALFLLLEMSSDTEWLRLRGLVVIEMSCLYRETQFCKEGTSSVKKRANTRFSLTAKGDAMRPAIIINVESLPSRMAGDRTRILCQSHLSHRELQGGHLLSEEASKYSLLTDSKGRRNAPRHHHQRLQCWNRFLPHEGGRGSELQVALVKRLALLRITVHTLLHRDHDYLVA